LNCLRFTAGNIAGIAGVANRYYSANCSARHLIGLRFPATGAILYLLFVGLRNTNGISNIFRTLLIYGLANGVGSLPLFPNRFANGIRNFLCPLFINRSANRVFFRPLFINGLANRVRNFLRLLFINRSANRVSSFAVFIYGLANRIGDFLCSRFIDRSANGIFFCPFFIHGLANCVRNFLCSCFINRSANSIFPLFCFPNGTANRVRDFLCSRFINWSADGIFPRPFFIDGFANGVRNFFRSCFINRFYGLTANSFVLGFPNRLANGISNLPGADFRNVSCAGNCPRNRNLFIARFIAGYLLRFIYNPLAYIFYCRITDACCAGTAASGTAISGFGLASDSETKEYSGKYSRKNVFHYCSPLTNTAATAALNGTGTDNVNSAVLSAAVSTQDGNRFRAGKYRLYRLRKGADFKKIPNKTAKLYLSLKIPFRNLS
jgi:hypothetical protein